MKSLGCYVVMLMAGVMLVSCNGSSGNAYKLCSPAVPEFPYQAYLDKMGEEDYFPVIGDDGGGFDAISNHVRYLKLPDGLTNNSYADSLTELYNTVLAYNAICYDISTAERNIDDKDIVKDCADALDSLSVDAIHNQRIRDALKDIGRWSAGRLREGKSLEEQNNSYVKMFYALFDPYLDAVIRGHDRDAEFDASKIVDGYKSIHERAINDTMYYRSELLQKLLLEKDFGRKCVYAREFAYANFKNADRDDKQLVAVLDQMLREEKYSPLLYELWLMWRTALQQGVLSGPSNDSGMYNLFYNDMRNRVALTYISHLASHPADHVAFNQFLRLATENNIVRNSDCLIGNNSMLDEMILYNDVWNNNADEM